jgi:peptidoglycan lytic transglycosylase G
MRRLLVVVLAVLVAGAAAAGVIYSRVDRPFKGYAAAEQFVEIPPGAGSSAIGRRLIEAGVVRDTLTWRIALVRSGQGRALKAGEYRFAGELRPADVIGRIARGEVYLRPITFPEGLSIAEMAKLFEARGFGAASGFAAAARNAGLIADLDPQARDLEGYLYPETYPLPRRADARMLVRTMVGRFERVFGPDARAAAAARGLSVREVVTLASLVEKETARPEERPTIAAVYLNRLKIGMGLQCDPTVIYALQKAGKYSGNLRRADLAFDSPYNTYKYAGLPPGAINSPGAAALRAALHPTPGQWLYFVTVNTKTGKTLFADSYAEHLRNVQRWCSNSDEC